MKKDDKQRLFEVMSRLDKTFKPKLNEGFSGPALAKAVISVLNDNLSDEEINSGIDKSFTVIGHYDCGDFSAYPYEKQNWDCQLDWWELDSNSYDKKYEMEIKEFVENEQNDKYIRQMIDDAFNR